MSQTLLSTAHGAALGAAMLAAATLGCAGDTIVRSGADQEDRIQVSGSARLRVAPDLASVVLGVQTFDADAVTAVTLNNQRTDAALAALRAQGIADADLQTSDFSISPQRAFREGRPDSVTGFWVSNTLSATVRDLATVGGVLEAVIEAGANQIQGLQFSVSDPDSLQDEARRLAVLDARRRAEVLAAAAGARVGRVITLTESSVSVPPFFRGAVEADASGAVPVVPGEVAVTAQVSAIFALE